MNRIGVLALQGDFEAHARKLGHVGAEILEVRRPEQLRSVRGLVLPGGESTTLLNLMQDAPWFEQLRTFHERGGAILATCAGTILIAREVREPSQPSLGLLDAVIQRNGYGRQIDSFETQLDVAGCDAPLHAMFIRAPRFLALGPRVVVLARFEGQPVLVREGRILAATFHPELSDDCELHRQFMKLVAPDDGPASSVWQETEASVRPRVAVR